MKPNLHFRCAVGAFVVCDDQQEEEVSVAEFGEEKEEDIELGEVFRS